MAQYFQVRSLVDKATVDSKDVTTGYLYVEINKLTESSDSACTAVLDYVLKKLRTKSPRVKQKALLVMKNCIEKGHPTFRSELLLRAEEVRAELGCTGPPDPHEGDGPYRRVREEADKVINMMYDEQYARREAPRAQQSLEGGQDSQPLPPPSFLPSPSPSSFGGGGSGGGGGGGPPRGKYEGMGNWTPPAASSSWVDKTVAATVAAVSGATTTVLEKTGLKSKPAVDYDDPEIYTRGGSTMSSSSYSGPTHGGDSGIRSLSSQQANYFEKNKKKSERRKKGEAGGAWKHEADEEEEEDEDQPAKPTGAHKFDYNALNKNRDMHESNGGNGGGGSGSGGGVGDEEGEGSRVKKTSAVELESSLEWRLVEGLTRGGGVRQVPSEAELLEFCTKSEALSWRDVTRALLARLDDPLPVVRLKALCGLLALVERGRPKGVARYLKKHPEALVGESSSANRAVRAKASAVVALVFGDDVPRGRAPVAAASEPEERPSTSSSSSNAPKASASEMLSFLDSPAPVSASPVATPSPSSAALFLNSPSQPLPSPSLQPMAVPVSGLHSLNLNAPTLQAGPTLVSQPFFAPSPSPYGGSVPAAAPPGYYIPQPQGPYYAPQPQTYFTAVPQQQQPLLQPGSQQRPFGANTAPQPAAANDSFNFVQSVVQNEKKGIK